jgi:RNA polymerase sigma factor (sigma-70 family)
MFVSLADDAAFEAFVRANATTLVRAIRALPYRQRAVLVLRFWHDLTEQQAADALGIRAGTVKSQTSRALQRLRQLLDTPAAQSAGGHHDRR